MSLTKRNLRMKCSNCGQWNGVPVNKIFIEQNSIEPKVKVFIPRYAPLQATRCEKCGNLIVKLKEILEIVKVERGDKVE